MNLHQIFDAINLCKFLVQVSCSARILACVTWLTPIIDDVHWM